MKPKKALELIRKEAEQWLRDADLDAASSALKPLRTTSQGHPWPTLDTRTEARDLIQRLYDLANGTLSPTFKPRKK